MQAFDDSIIKEMYRDYDIPCDTLISDQELLLPFAEDYIKRTSHEVEPSQLARHLLTLRKHGETNGGSPRLRRSYNGKSKKII